MKTKSIPLSLVLGTLFLQPHFSYAQGSASGTHGGGIMMCFNQPVDERGHALPNSSKPLVITKHELQDYWEWKNKSNFPLIAQTGNTLKEKFISTAKRITPLDPLVGLALDAAIQNDFKDVGLSDDGEIPRIDDATTDLGLERNCHILQVARQKDFPMPGEKKILIYKPYFNLLSEDQKAMLYQHEYFYSFALKHFPKNKVPDSNLVRHYNYMVSSQSGFTQNKGTYADIMSDLYQDDTDANRSLFNHTDDLKRIGIAWKDIASIQYAEFGRLYSFDAHKYLEKVTLKYPLSFNLPNIKASAEVIYFENPSDGEPLVWAKRLGRLEEYTESFPVTGGRGFITLDDNGKFGSIDGCSADFKSFTYTGICDGGFKVTIKKDDGTQIGPLSLYAVQSHPELLSVNLSSNFLDFKTRIISNEKRILNGTLHSTKEKCTLMLQRPAGEGFPDLSFSENMTVQSAYGCQFSFSQSNTQIDLHLNGIGMFVYDTFSMKKGALQIERDARKDVYGSTLYYQFYDFAQSFLNEAFDYTSINSNNICMGGFKVTLNGFNMCTDQTMVRILPIIKVDADNQASEIFSFSRIDTRGFNRNLFMNSYGKVTARDLNTNGDGTLNITPDNTGLRIGSHGIRSITLNFNGEDHVLRDGESVLVNP